MLGIGLDRGALPANAVATIPHDTMMMPSQRGPPSLTSINCDNGGFQLRQKAWLMGGMEGEVEERCLLLDISI